MSVGPVYSIVIQPDNNAVLGSADRVIGGPLAATPLPTPTPTPNPTPNPTPTPVPVPPTVTITAKSTKLAENGPKDKVIVTRTGDVSADLTIAYSAKGSAQSGVNYKHLSGTVVIPAGSATVAIKLKPVDDGVADGTLVLKLTLLPSDAYIIGASGKAKIKILNVGLIAVAADYE